VRRGAAPARLREFAARAEQAREEERRHLARTLHDELGQVLTSLKLEFMWLVDELGKSDPKPGIQLVNKLQALVGLIEVSIQSVRLIAGDLRPAVLDHYLSITGMTEEEFMETMKKHRHPRLRHLPIFGEEREDEE